MFKQVRNKVLSLIFRYRIHVRMFRFLHNIMTMMATIKDCRFTFGIVRKRREYKDKQTHTPKSNTTMIMIENKKVEKEPDHRIKTKHIIPTNIRLNVKQ